MSCSQSSSSTDGDCVLSVALMYVCVGVCVRVVLCYLSQWVEVIGIPASPQHYVTGAHIMLMKTD